MVNAPAVDTYDATKPATTFATKLLISHTPISNEASFTGASLETIDSPIGDKHSSPIVWSR